MASIENEPTTGFSWPSAFRHVACGLAMGVADIIPGVSGGTVALVLGIYTRLVTAISHCDQQFFGLITARRWREAAAHIDLGFLISLGLGIATGIIVMGLVIHELIHSDFARPLTFAAFFGMIAASALLVMRMIRISSWPQFVSYLVLALIAAAFAWWLTTLGLATDDDPNLWYLFLCGVIGICAMILPGISGAHLLLILGAYVFVTGSLRNIAKGDVSLDVLLSLGVFAAGCVVGLLAFSKVLRWLLTNWHAPTMAVLCGFMVGAMRKVWPFQLLEKIQVGDKSRDLLTPYWPTEFATQQWLAVAVAVAAFALVMVVDHLANASTRKHALRPSSEAT